MIISIIIVIESITGQAQITKFIALMELVQAQDHRLWYQQVQVPVESTSTLT